MGLALEVISGFVTAPSTTFTAWTLASGNSLTIRNTSLDSKIILLNAWALNQSVGTLQIRSPKLHDNVRGIRLDIIASEAKPLLPSAFQETLFPQDTLVVEQTGSATGSDIEQGAMLIFYEDLPGANARLITVATLMERMAHIVTVENTLTMGTSGGYSAEEAINAESDLFKANTDYALLGYLVDGEVGTVRWRGADTSNMGVGGPGDDLGRDFTRSWFLDLSRMFNLPMIPVFNSANRAGILVDATNDENALTLTITSIFGELSPGTGIPGPGA